MGKFAPACSAPVEKFRMVLIVVAALLAASAVSVAGRISFVGLCVAHIRMMHGEWTDG